MGASPAHAEAGKIFDFNATLPVMAVQFILLTIYLDKNWFGPIGKLIDERNNKIQTTLRSLKCGNDELDAMQQEAKSLISDARAEANDKISEEKAKSAVRIEKEIDELKIKLDDEMRCASKKLADEMITAYKDLESKDLEPFIELVLPTGFTLEDPKDNTSEKRP